MTDMTPNEQAELAQQMFDLLDIDPVYDSDVELADIEWQDGHLQVTINDVKVPTAETADDIVEFYGSFNMAVEYAILNALSELAFFDEQNPSVKAEMWQDDKTRYR